MNALEKERIENLSLYQSLSDKSKRELMEKARLMEVSKSRFVFRMREKVERVYIVLEGFAVLERESLDHGKKSILILSSGDIANEVILDNITSSVACRAISELSVLAIEKAIFLDLMRQNFSFNKLVLDSMALKIRKLYRLVEGSTKTTRLDHQIASRIWKFARDYGLRDGDTIKIPFELQITLLASFVGSNRETISRIVKQMTKEGILSIENKLCIVYDMEALKHYRKS